MASRASEVRATSQGNLAAALATVQETGRAISDRLQVEPASLVDALVADNSDLLSDMDAEGATRERIDRLVRDRDAIGAVNLAAEQEADDLQTRLSELANERADLDSAIAKLRGAIGTLNRDGRERISSRFEEINANFRDIFSQLFGGGRAHLALVGSDDPLEAGLEVYASPPGKKLASLA